MKQGILFFEKVWLLIIKNSQFIFIGLLIFHFTVAMFGITFPIIEQHGFRQTQTAISVFYFLKDGFTLDYLTPVVGYPWKIPFEFPTYQFIVGGVCKLFSTELEITGRVVSLLFFYSLISIIYINAGKLNLPKKITLALLLIHPTYIFWSRTFMIESTVLFLSFSSLIYGLLYYKSKRSAYLYVFCVFGFLAALTKVTTFLNAMICLSVYIVIDVVIKNHFKVEIKKYYPLVLGIIAMLFVFTLWNKHCDTAKSLSYIGSTLTSKKLEWWNFGTFEARFVCKNWLMLLSNSAYTYVLAVIGILLGIWKRKQMPILFWAFLLTGLLTPLVLFNLYKIHSYYHYANSIYILFAFGIWIYLNPLPSVKIIFFTILTFFFLYQYRIQYWTDQRIPNMWIKDISISCKELSNEEDVLLVMGTDWSSEVPFFSERKAICLGNEQVKQIQEQPRQFIKQVNTQNINLLMLTGKFYSDTNATYVSEIRNYLDLNKSFISDKLNIAVYRK